MWLGGERQQGSFLQLKEFRVLSSQLRPREFTWEYLHDWTPKVYLMCFYSQKHRKEKERKRKNKNQTEDPILTILNHGAATIGL